MQINNSALNLSAIGQTAAADPAKTVSKSHSHDAGGDRVEISNLAAQLSADPSRLAQLQAAYQSGTYRVSPSQIANGIIQDAME